MKKIIFVTGNVQKALQLGRHLSCNVEHRKLDLPEIQSLSLEEVALDKARRAYEIVGAPVLVEDTALTFTALGSLPGPLIKWFLESLGNEGLVRLLNGFQSREAHAEVCFVLHDENGPRVYKGEAAGSIAEAPRGERGFGWDPIFVPAGYTATWGEMDEETQNATSMRRKALRVLQEYVSQHYR